MSAPRVLTQQKTKTMFQNSITIKNRHRRFIEEIIQQECVWGLQSKWGFASTISNQFEDKNEESIGIICFWSNEELATICAKKYWKEYEPTKITLSDFLENWCMEIHNDHLLIGTNFDWNLSGQENEPLELLVEITSKLLATKTELFFDNFEGVGDLKVQAKSMLYGVIIPNEGVLCY